MGVFVHASVEGCADRAVVWDAAVVACICAWRCVVGFCLAVLGAVGVVGGGSGCASGGVDVAMGVCAVWLCLPHPVGGLLGRRRWLVGRFFEGGHVVFVGRGRA